MLKFRDVKPLQKFSSILASIHNHFNLDRHLNSRETFKKNRSGALADGFSWRHEIGVSVQFGDWFALV